MIMSEGKREWNNNAENWGKTLALWFNWNGYQEGSSKEWRRRLLELRMIVTCRQWCPSEGRKTLDNYKEPLQTVVDLNDGHFDSWMQKQWRRFLLRRLLSRKFVHHACFSTQPIGRCVYRPSFGRRSADSRYQSTFCRLKYTLYKLFTLLFQEKLRVGSQGPLIFLGSPT